MFFFRDRGITAVSVKKKIEKENKKGDNVCRIFQLKQNVKSEIRFYKFYNVTKLQQVQKSTFTLRF